MNVRKSLMQVDTSQKADSEPKPAQTSSDERLCQIIVAINHLPDSQVNEFLSALPATDYDGLLLVVNRIVGHYMSEFSTGFSRHDRERLIGPYPDYLRVPTSPHTSSGYYDDSIGHRICSVCGAELNVGTVRCSHCGRTIR